jgi:hypothetical protein
VYRGSDAEVRSQRSVALRNSAYWKKLIGTGGTWFLFDISYYGTVLCLMNQVFPQQDLGEPDKSYLGGGGYDTWVE